MRGSGDTYLPNEDLKDMRGDHDAGKPDYVPGLSLILSATALVLYLAYWFLG